jgi:hypothetical protein
MPRDGQRGEYRRTRRARGCTLLARERDSESPGPIATEAQAATDLRSANAGATRTLTGCLPANESGGER